MLERGCDFGITRLNRWVRYIARSMQVSKGAEALHLEAVSDEPAGRLGEENGPGKQHRSENSLHDVGSPPRYFTWCGEKEAIANPSRDRIASVKADVLDRDEKTACMAGGDLALQNRDGHGQHSNGDALGRSSNDEGGETGGEDLNEGGDEIHNGAYAHRHASAKDIADIGRA